jgi:hypothetical protein
MIKKLGKSSPLKNRKVAFKLVICSIAIIFISINVIAYFHAYKFTHFADNTVTKTKNAKSLSTTEKIKTLIFGVDNPRPQNKSLPIQPFTTVKLNSNKEIECWSIKTENSKGTVILFHGFGGQKSSMLDKSDVFLRLGYNTLLVDFMGSGDSEGNQTTVGFFEANQVKSCYDHVVNSGEDKIYLFGTSMGAVAIMKALNDFEINPAAIMIECPFGSMYQTVCARFKTMNAPTFPMAGLLVFWGGIQNGFWAFGHNPSEYARNINCSTLLMYGEQDEKVSREEIDEIFGNLPSTKQLKIYSRAGHENYLSKYRDQWTKDIETFLIANAHVSR